MRRKHRRLVSNPELDITPFLNLMIVLVPVLLLGMVFSQIRMIELDFPGIESGEAPQADELRLVVALIPQGLEVLDSERGVIRTLPLIEGEQNFDGLRETLKQIKKRVPEKTGRRSGSQPGHRLPDSGDCDGHAPLLSGSCCSQCGEGRAFPGCGTGRRT